MPCVRTPVLLACLLTFVYGHPLGVYGHLSGGYCNLCCHTLGLTAGRLDIVQAVAASANKLVTRYLKGENTHVNLLYLGAVSTIGALFMCLVLSHSFQKPGSGLVSGLLLANGMHTAVALAFGCFLVQASLFSHLAGRLMPCAGSFARCASSTGINRQLRGSNAIQNELHDTARCGSD